MKKPTAPQIQNNTLKTVLAISAPGRSVPQPERARKAQFAVVRRTHRDD
jgi:hypothetical protein